MWLHHPGEEIVKAALWKNKIASRVAQGRRAFQINSLDFIQAEILLLTLEPKNYSSYV